MTTSQNNISPLPTKNPSIKQSMESQILQMLKGVIIDEDKPTHNFSQCDELDSNLFDDEQSAISYDKREYDFSESDINSIESNTNLSSFNQSHNTFIKGNNKLKISSKMQNSMFDYHTDASLSFINNRDIKRKKFPTQRVYQNEMTCFHKHLGENSNMSICHNNVGNMNKSINGDVVKRNEQLKKKGGNNGKNDELKCGKDDINLNLNMNIYVGINENCTNEMMKIFPQYNTKQQCGNTQQLTCFNNNIIQTGITNSKEIIYLKGINNNNIISKSQIINTNNCNMNNFNNNLTNFNINDNNIYNNQPSRIQSSFYYQSLQQTKQSPQLPSQIQTLTIGDTLIDDPIALKLESLISQEGNGIFTYSVYSKLEGLFPLLIKNQQASRICQHHLTFQTPLPIIHLIFYEISFHLHQLLIDPYANYFCLKLFYFLTNKDRIIFLKNLESFLFNLSINKIATYPIQCIIEKLTTYEEQNIIFNSLCTHLMKLSLDVYGSHILEKIITNFDYNIVKSISVFIIENFVFLANNVNGLCVVKQIIQIEYKKEYFFQIKKQIISNVLLLIQNPYGNYALQVAIEVWNENDCFELLALISNKSTVLSMQKYSSNVIEKCLKKSEVFLNEFISMLCNHEPTLVLLLKNNYGNYVLQTTLKISKNVNHDILLRLIEKNLNHLTDKKTLNKWKCLISDYVNFPNSY